jgi:hypothetical protein
MCAALANCVTAPSVPGNLSVRGVPFVATPAPLLMVRGRLEGTAYVHDGWVDVVVSRGTVWLNRGDTRQWQYLRVYAGLATNASCDRRWCVHSQSRPVALRSVLGLPAGFAPDSTYVLADSLRFEVAVPRGTPVERTRLVFEFEWPDVVGRYADMTFAISSTDSLLFARATSR